MTDKSRLILKAFETGFSLTKLLLIAAAVRDSKESIPDDKSSEILSTVNTQVMIVWTHYYYIFGKETAEFLNLSPTKITSLDSVHPYSLQMANHLMTMFHINYPDKIEAAFKLGTFLINIPLISKDPELLPALRKNQSMLLDPLDKLKVKKGDAEEAVKMVLSDLEIEREEGYEIILEFVAGKAEGKRLMKYLSVEPELSIGPLKIKFPS